MKTKFEIHTIPSEKYPESYAKFSVDQELSTSCAVLDGKWDGSVELHWFTDEKGGCDGNESIYIGDLDFFIDFLLEARAKAREHFKNEKWPNL